MQKILWHGSSVKVDKLIPNQAMDVGFEEGCKLAVYATSNRNMAICFALGCVADEKEPTRTMMPEFCVTGLGVTNGYLNNPEITAKSFIKNPYGKGYLYKLDSTGFEHAMGSQWTCMEEVIPLEVIEINVDDYLELCVVR